MFKTQNATFFPEILVLLQIYLREKHYFAALNVKEEIAALDVIKKEALDGSKFIINQTQT